MISLFKTRLLYLLFDDLLKITLKFCLLLAEKYRVRSLHHSTRSFLCGTVLSMMITNLGLIVILSSLLNF